MIFLQLSKEILAHLLSQCDAEILFPGLELNARQIIEIRSYCALQKIQEILKDDSLSDPECFEKIEAIVHVFESIGSSCGIRHDFR